MAWSRSCVCPRAVVAWGRYYVRQCDTVKEATARIKELHVSKKFRCAVFDMCDYSKMGAGAKGPRAMKEPKFGSFNTMQFQQQQQQFGFGAKPRCARACVHAHGIGGSALLFAERFVPLVSVAVLALGMRPSLPANTAASAPPHRPIHRHRAVCHPPPPPPPPLP